jgi:hypothetical protein
VDDREKSRQNARHLPPVVIHSLVLTEVSNDAIDDGSTQQELHDSAILIGVVNNNTMYNSIIVVV